MRRTWSRAIGLLALALVAIPAGEAAAQRWEWWHDAAVQRDLSLSDEQVRTLDDLFRTGLRERRATKRALDQAQGAFRRALADGDEPAALALIPRVAELQVQQNTARTILLLRMSWVLTADQEARLRTHRRNQSRGRRLPRARGG